MSINKTEEFEKWFEETDIAGIRGAWNAAAELYEKEIERLEREIEIYERFSNKIGTILSKEIK